MAITISLLTLPLRRKIHQFSREGEILTVSLLLNVLPCPVLCYYVPLTTPCLSARSPAGSSYYYSTPCISEAMATQPSEAARCDCLLREERTMGSKRALKSSQPHHKPSLSPSLLSPSIPCFSLDISSLSPCASLKKWLTLRSSCPFCSSLPLAGPPSSVL